MSRLKKIYSFLDFEKWDGQLHRAIVDFKLKHQIYPNIMIASSNTFSNLDQRSSLDKVISKCGYLLNGPIILEGFFSEEYDITFCLDDMILEKNFFLIADKNLESRLIQ